MRNFSKALGRDGKIPLNPLFSKEEADRCLNLLRCYVNAELCTVSDVLYPYSKLDTKDWVKQL